MPASTTLPQATTRTLLSNYLLFWAGDCNECIHNERDLMHRSNQRLRQNGAVALRVIAVCTAILPAVATAVRTSFARTAVVACVPRRCFCATRVMTAGIWIASPRLWRTCLRGSGCVMLACIAQVTRMGMPLGTWGKGDRHRQRLMLWLLPPPPGERKPGIRVGSVVQEIPVLGPPNSPLTPAQRMHPHLYAAVIVMPAC